MDSFSQFRTIDELIKVFDRERLLFRDMFERRKKLYYTIDYVMELVEHKRERIQYLIDHGVIHESGNFLELEDVYVQFFEDVLDMNEEISVASVSEYIDSLKENINYFLNETNEHRKLQYHRTVRKTIRKIGLRTLRNVIDLKRNVDDVYKQEPNYQIKKMRLVNYDEKRKNIKVLMTECERLIDGDKIFFGQTADVDMLRTCMDVRNDFTDANHTLLEIEHQIIDYLNRIEQQSQLFKKIRRLKYLKDQLTWREDTNIERTIQSCDPIWMEPRRYNRVFLSLDLLSSDEDAYKLIRKIADKAKLRRHSRTEAAPIDTEYLAANTENIASVNIPEMWNAFKAQGSDLFTFIRNFRYKQERTINDHIILYCQLATIYSDNLRFTKDYEVFEHVEYALIYAN